MYHGDGETTAGAGDIAALESAVTLFRVRPRGARPAAQLRGRMLRLRHLIDVLELEFARDAASLAGCDELEWQGHISPIQWVKHECRTATTAAIDACEVGAQAARLPESFHALADGAIGFGHLALLARTAEAITSSETSSGFEEALLLAKARQHSVGKFRHDCEHARHAADQRRFLTEQIDQVEARTLELKPAAGGALFLRGFLDCEGGATLRTALESLARRAGHEDLRHRDRRLADALVELAGHALDSGALPQSTGQRPHLQVTATLDTLRGLDGSPAGELEWGARSPPRPSGGWAAMPRWPGCSSTQSRRSSMSAGHGGCPLRRRAGPSGRATVAASGLAASGPRPGHRPTTSATGPRGVRLI
jgi:hypothetical protein